MKFQVTFKDTDALYDALYDAIDKEDFSNLSEVEYDEVKQSRAETVNGLCCEKWFKWGEYLTVEIDESGKKLGYNELK